MFCEVMDGRGEERARCPRTRLAADVYYFYYGDEAIALQPTANSQYEVINGRHRLVAARDAGLQKVPARIL